MRAALLLLLIGSAVVAATDDSIPLLPDGSPNLRLLDKSPRARTVASWNTVEVTEAEFRKMRQRYRPQDFNMWEKRLHQLRRGMTQTEIIQLLHPKDVGPIIIGGQIVSYPVVLNDAYFADIFIDPYSKRMLYASPPLAMTYEIKPIKKKSPKT